MLNDMLVELQKYSVSCDSLLRILRDSQLAFEDIRCNQLLSAEIKEKLSNSHLISYLFSKLGTIPTLLVFGQNCHAKALFVNALLETLILPTYSSNWRWIKFKYGQKKAVHLTLSPDFEFFDQLKAHEDKWNIIPQEDLQRTENESPDKHCPTVEIELSHYLLKDNNFGLIVPPDCTIEQFNDVLEKNLDTILPVIVYAISSDVLSDSDIQEIRLIKEKYSDLPILFVTVSNSEGRKSTESLTESEQHFLEISEKKLENVGNRLKRLGYLADSTNNNENDETKRRCCTECVLENNLISDANINASFVALVRNVLKYHLLSMSSTLCEIHNYCLRTFIMSAFDMAREIQITPKRIIYAQNIEEKLFSSLMRIASENHDEITAIIQATLQDMKMNISDVLNGYEYKCDQQPSVKLATLEIHQLVLKRLSTSVGKQLVKSVTYLQDSFIGTLRRCLESLEKSCQELEGNLLASDALKQILSAAYNIDLQSTTKFTVVQTFIDRVRKLIHSFQLWSTHTPPKFDLQWQTEVVMELIDSLSASKLAKTVSAQFQEQVRASHESFKSAIKLLENQLSGRLEHTEEQRIAIRKRHTPRFARLALESTSLCDLLRYGMPKVRQEIGRGQYGVVFSCEAWGHVDPCAVKSVVPQEDRHWNDLAMEFYYTRTIPEHPRIVKLRGSVIDHTYGGGSSTAVLLVMDRMTRDLYCGLRQGLPWSKRIQIAIDVVEGIRYLHSQGLVHRDIKLKNVLLDEYDRAKLTDFGFCIPEAMMSGSIVGTPVHMAPELLSGRYDSSVDVYAFGILFWYICSGQTKLPNRFEQFHNKEQLWTSVRKGIRPECLQNFTQACWNLMEQCWAAEPCDRPLLGYVQPQLEMIQRNSVEDESILDSNSFGSTD